MTTNPHSVPSKEWEDILEKGDMFRHLRWVFRWLPHNPRCELCLAPFAGIGGTMVRTFKGIKPSALNPHYCNDCELVSEDHPGGAEADVALLFADIRGSTTLAETMEPAERRRIWRGVVAACEELADEFLDVLDKDRLPARLEPL